MHGIALSSYSRASVLSTKCTLTTFVAASEAHKRVRHKRVAPPAPQQTHVHSIICQRFDVARKSFVVNQLHAKRAHISKRGTAMPNNVVGRQRRVLVQAIAHFVQPMTRQRPCVRRHPHKPWHGTHVASPTRRRIMSEPQPVPHRPLSRRTRQSWLQEPFGGFCFSATKKRALVSCRDDDSR